MADDGIEPFKIKDEEDKTKGLLTFNLDNFNVDNVDQKAFEKKWRETMNESPHEYPILTAPSPKIEIKLDDVSIVDDEAFAQLMMIEPTVQITLKVEIEMDGKFKLTDESKHSLELLKDFNEDTRDMSAKGKFKRRFRKCRKGDSCVKCNNERLILALLHQNRRTIFEELNEEELKDE